jgi:hypothetical protein
MKRVILSWMVVTMSGCVAVDTPDETGNQPSSEASFVSSIDGWCDTTCARLSACPEQCDCVGDTCTCRSGPGDECAEDCRDALEEYAGQGDACAERGQELMLCIDRIQTCDELYDDYDCETERDADEVCDDHDDDGDVDVAPPSARYVTCHVGFGGGTAGAAGGGNVSAFSCESAYDECTDGARYQVVCQGTSASATCNCFRSGQFSGSFESAPATCPTTADMNAGCGWTLDPRY